MKYCLSILLIFTTFCLVGFKGSSVKSTISQTKNTESKVIENESPENKKWLSFINAKSDSLQNLYTKNAIKILADGSQLNGNLAIQSHYQNQNITISSIKSESVILANEKRAIEYEMGEYIDNENQKYKHIVIWVNKNDHRKRDFEFVVKSKPFDDVKSAIDERRDKWIERCNVHDAKSLIEDLYSKNTLYYNHKPLVVGRELLIKEYGYMNNEKYTLNLTPIVSEQVDNEFVFEIGQCKGSYKGKYIIIWRKSDLGKWEVFIDSNI